MECIEVYEIHRTRTICPAVVVLSFLCFPERWHCHGETRRSEVIVLLGIIRAISWYIEWKYWFKIHTV